MSCKLIFALLSTCLATLFGSRDFHECYSNSTYKFALSLPKGVLVREFSSNEATILKGSNTTIAHNVIAHLRVVPRTHASDLRINSTDELATSAISDCVDHCMQGGSDGDTECEPTDSVYFSKLPNGIRYVKFYLRRVDTNKRGSRFSFVGPFYGFDISSQHTKFVLVISDGGYLLPKVNNQSLQWQVARSLVMFN